MCFILRVAHAQKGVEKRASKKHSMSDQQRRAWRNSRIHNTVYALKANLLCEHLTIERVGTSEEQR